MKLSPVRRLCCLLTILAIPALCLGAVRDAQQAAFAPNELVVLNWADYMDPELVKEFEQKFNAKVRQVYYESDDTRDAMLAESDGKGYDVVLVSGAALGVYRKQGWLTPITPSDVPNLRHINPRWRNAHASASGYAVPYFWGTLGIGYRTDLVPEKIISWKQLYRPSERLRGKLGMIKSSRDIIGMALKALGYSANSSDPKQLAEAEQLLKGQKPYVVGDYSYVDLDEKSDLVTGKIVASMMYSGDALMVKEHHPQIAYVLPEEGGNLWVDYLTVMNRSQDRELAMAFINFLNQPKIAARLAEFVYYATPNKAAEKLMPQEFLQDPTIYPHRQQLEKSEFYTELPPRAAKKRNRIFNDIIR